MKLYDLVVYDIPGFFRNIWNFRKWLWRNRDWDWGYLVEVMELKFRLMAEQSEKYGHHVDSSKNAKRLKICAELCKRIREDKYFDNMSGPTTTIWKYEEPTSSGGIPISIQTFDSDGIELTSKQIVTYHKLAERNKDNDLAYLTTLMRKHLLGWWE